jgi:transcriptional regulator with XRE-family HTH domain
MLRDDSPSRLRMLRTRRSLTTRKRAELTGINKQTLDSYMRATDPAFPGAEALERLARGFDVSLDWLVLGPKPMISHGRTGKNAATAAREVVRRTFRQIIGRHVSGEPLDATEATFLGLTPEEWGLDRSHDAARRAHVINASYPDNEAIDRMLDEGDGAFRQKVLRAPRRLRGAPPGPAGPPPDASLSVRKEP